MTALNDTRVETLLLAKAFLSPVALCGDDAAMVKQRYGRQFD
ncbi:hypothetical protein [Cryobacterium roopkundense]|uniref:Uncharacterized protein n=1 Tax=Cryobacterium roopkundense TaxID=1001240 RepID=A0A7W9A0G4_9MICO|nr:hypothetical protein [Cryobacterium roopkundense]MBB5643542.1 hypothetical protein [Cryobacterium roopkundense]